MNIERARKKDFSELMDAMHRAFLADRPEFERFEELHPDLYRPSSDAMHHIYLIRSNGRIASAAGLFPISLAIGPIRLRVAGIGGVCTLPEHRGKGAMSALILHLLREARSAGYPIAWLSGQRRRYARFGFERAGSSMVIRVTAAARGPHQLPWQIAQAPPDATTLRTLIALRSSLRVRGLCDDETYRLKLTRKHVEIWTAILGSARAYVVVHRKNNWCLEWGGDVEGVRALLGHLAALGPVWLLRISPLRDEYTDMLLNVSEQYDGNQDCLAVLSTSILLKEYQPLLKTYWPEGQALQLVVEDEPDLSVNLASGRVIRRPAPGAQLVRVTKSHLARLLFGPLPANVATALPANSMWIRQVFPLPFAMPGLWRV